MTNLNYKEIVGEVESSLPRQVAKRKHYVFKVTTADFDDKSSIEVSPINKWRGCIKVTTEDGNTFYEKRDISGRSLVVGEEVDIDRVFSELSKCLDGALRARKSEDFVCFTFEFLNCRFDFEDCYAEFNHIFNVREPFDHLPNKRLKRESAKTITFYI